MTLQELNTLDAEQALQAFLQCCTAQRWAEAMTRDRPYASLHDLHAHASEIWRGLDESDYLEAFEGHPQIGNVDTLRKKYAHTKTLASNEQNGVTTATEATLTALAEGNQRYLQQNGFIFIVCASGKSADEMLALLQERLQHSREAELHIAAEQQQQITAIRLNKLLQAEQ